MFNSRYATGMEPLDKPIQFIDCYDALDFAERRGRWKNRKNIDLINVNINNQSQEKIKPFKYDRFDFFKVKSMLDFHTDTLVLLSDHASDILHQAMKTKIKDAKIKKIIEDSLFPQVISSELLKELCEDIQAINIYTSKRQKELGLQNDLHYNKSMMVKMFYDAAIELVSEKKQEKNLKIIAQTIKQNNVEKNPIINSNKVNINPQVEEKKPKLLFGCIPLSIFSHKKKNKHNHQQQPIQPSVMQQRK